MSTNIDPTCCRQKDCDNPAIFRYTWPGQDESYCCISHAAKLSRIAEAMGLHLQLIRLTAGDYLNLTEDPK